VAIVLSLDRFANLANSISSKLKIDFIQLESKIFPDEESYLRIPASVKDEKVVVVHSCFPQQDKRLIEFFMILDNVIDLGAKEIISVIPYLAYARQDKRFRDGETIGVSTIAKLIKLCGSNTFITVNIHEKSSLDLFNIRSINLSAMLELGRYIKRLELKNPIVVAPDRGALRDAKEVAKVMQTDFTFFDKTRDLKTGEVTAGSKEADVGGRDVVIVDDIISTGGTIANVAKIVKNQGAKKVLAACTHALLIKDSRNILQNAGVNKIIGTDTVECDVSRVSVANIIVDALRTLV
jgi:ribose-phosphate pyrophosphokinase